MKLRTCKKISRTQGCSCTCVCPAGDPGRVQGTSASSTKCALTAVLKKDPTFTIAHQLAGEMPLQDIISHSSTQVFISKGSLAEGIVLDQNGNIPCATFKYYVSKVEISDVMATNKVNKTCYNKRKKPLKA